MQWELLKFLNDINGFFYKNALLLSIAEKFLNPLWSYTSCLDAFSLFLYVLLLLGDQA